MNEEDRMIAILRGNYIAQHFPKTWYGMEERKAVQKQTNAQKLRDELERKLNRKKK